VSARDFVRFLMRWQHVLPETRREGRRGVLAVVEQLQGFELAAGAWEPSVLSARVSGYRPEWLDALCLSGEVAWGRLSARAGAEPASEAPRRASPSRVTPITLARRDDLDWLLSATRGAWHPAAPEGLAGALAALLQEKGALFHGELARGSDAVPAEVEAALWELVSRGLVTSDGFESLRQLLGARQRTRRGASGDARDRLRRRGRVPAEGRWSRLPEPPLAEPDALAEALAEQLLARWGVVFYDLFALEGFTVSWRETLWALRRLEDRGLVRGGRFVTGFAGEQFALPGAVEALRGTRRLSAPQEPVVLSAADPLNLTGGVAPGPRVPAQSSRRIVIADGLIGEAEAPERVLRAAAPGS